MKMFSVIKYLFKQYYIIEINFIIFVIFAYFSPLAIMNSPKTAAKWYVVLCCAIVRDGGRGYIHT